jgi:glucose/arabinose dehydrogenase
LLHESAIAAGSAAAATTNLTEAFMDANPFRLRRSPRSRIAAATLLAATSLLVSRIGAAQDAPAAPTMTVPNLSVRTAVGSFTTPIGVAFLSSTEWFVIEKMTGHVRLVQNGTIGPTVLDLGVNNFSERGLLGIALHPNFAQNNFVYLFWSCKAPGPTGDPFFPVLDTCEDTPEVGPDSRSTSKFPCSEIASTASSGTGRRSRSIGT